MKVAKVRVRWIPPSEGGRKEPFAGAIYAAPSVWNNAAADADKSEWTAVVAFSGQRDAQGMQEGVVRFLTEESPHELIRCKATFALFEGTSRTLVGEVIAEPDQLPWTPAFEQKLSA